MEKSNLEMVKGLPLPTLAFIYLFEGRELVEMLSPLKYLIDFHLVKDKLF